MMINIVLFNEEPVIRIAQRAMEYFSSYDDLRTTENTIWLDGLYLRFYPKLITINAFNPSKYPSKDVAVFLKNILVGEEIFILSKEQNNKYIENADSLTCSDFLALDYMV